MREVVGDEEDDMRGPTSDRNPYYFSCFNVNIYAISSVIPLNTLNN
jgi:hypothetical protein